MHRIIPYLISKFHKETVGTVCTFVAMMCYSAQDAVLSVTERIYPPLQMVWLNALIVLTLLLGNIFMGHGWNGIKAAVHTHKLKLHIVRGVATACGIVMALTAISMMPLPNFYTLIFVGPLLSIILSGIFLQEHIGWRKGTAAALGFAGVFIVLRPDINGFNTASLLVLGAALIFGTNAILSRYLGKADGVAALVFYPQIMLAVLFAIPALMAAKAIAPEHIPLILLTGLFGTGGFVLNSQAIRLVPVYIIAAAQLCQIIWGTLAQYALHGTLPDAHTLQGAALIILSNLIIIFVQYKTRKTETAT